MAELAMRTETEEDAVRLKTSLAIALALFGFQPAVEANAAENYFKGGRPLTIVVPYRAGGGADGTVRDIAAQLEQIIDHPVQVQNKDGAGGQIGMSFVAQSRPDGYTIGFTPFPTVVAHYSEEGREAPFTRESFTPVILYTSLDYGLAVQSDSPWQTFDEYLEASKASPEGLTVATGGRRTTSHVELAVIQEATGANLRAVHFNGGAAAQAAILGGHVSAYAGGPDLLKHARSGDLRILAYAAPERRPFAPDVPTFKEQGYDILFEGYSSFVGPAGMDPENVAFLSDAIAQVVTNEAFSERMISGGLTPRNEGPEAFAKIWADYDEQIGTLLRGIE